MSKQSEQLIEDIGDVDLTCRDVIINLLTLNPLDAGRRLTDFSQTSYAAGSRLTYKTVNQRSGS